MQGNVLDLYFRAAGDSAATALGRTHQRLVCLCCFHPLLCFMVKLRKALPGLRCFVIYFCRLLIGSFSLWQNHTYLCDASTQYVY